MPGAVSSFGLLARGLGWCMPAALGAGRYGLMGNNNTTTNPRKILIHSVAPGLELPSGPPLSEEPKGGRGFKVTMVTWIFQGTEGTGGTTSNGEVFTGSPRKRDRGTEGTR